MSLILEALKKSEARRRLGEAPDLETSFAMQRRRRSPLPLIAASIVIAAGAGWWLLRTQATNKPAPTKSMQLQEKPIAVATTVARATPPATIAPPPSAPAPPPTVASVTPEQAPISAWLPVASEQPRPVGKKPATMATPAATRVNTPMAAAQAPAVVAPGLKETGAVPAAPGVKKAERPPQMMPVAGGKKPELPSEAAPAAGVKKPEPLAATASANNVANAKIAVTTSPIAAASPGAQSYYELPFSLRKDMPAIKISMHVYAPESPQRFIILNGARMAEGDTQDDLAIREIRPDGVVFEFHGQRLFYPRDGQ